MKKGLLLLFIIIAGCRGEQAESLDVTVIANPSDDFLFGTSAAISADGKVIAIGSSAIDTWGLGQLSVCSYDGGEWNERAVFTNQLGIESLSAALSENGDYLTLSGELALYHWDGQSYQRTEISNYYSVNDGIEISADGTLIASGDAVFREESGEWRNLNAYRDLRDEYLLFGSVLGMSCDGNLIAQGISYYSELAEDAGAVALYRYEQDGYRREELLQASQAGGYFASELCLSADGSTLAVSGLRYDSDLGQMLPGVTLFYDRDGVWEQGESFFPEDRAELFYGQACAMNSNGSVLLVVSANTESSNSGDIYSYRESGPVRQKSKLGLALPVPQSYAEVYRLELSENGRVLLTVPGVENGQALIFRYL